MRWGQNWRWASGAAVAVVAAGTGLSTHLALRASSEAALGWPVLLGGGLLLALALWPLAARTTSIGTLTAVLAVAQFGTHALAVLAAGQATGAGSLVCCPGTTQVRDGLLGQLTAEAGWLLAMAQFASCFLLAVAIRGGRAAADLLASTVALVRSVLSLVCTWTVALLRIPVLDLTVRTNRPTPARVLDAGRIVARRTTRRGPPTAAFTPALSHAVVAPLVLPAAG